MPSFTLRRSSSTSRIGEYWLWRWRFIPLFSQYKSILSVDKSRLDPRFAGLPSLPQQMPVGGYPSLLKQQLRELVLRLASVFSCLVAKLFCTRFLLWFLCAHDPFIVLFIIYLCKYVNPWEYFVKHYIFSVDMISHMLQIAHYLLVIVLLIGEERCSF